MFLHNKKKIRIYKKRTNSLLVFCFMSTISTPGKKTPDTRVYLFFLPVKVLLVFLFECLNFFVSFVLFFSVCKKVWRAIPENIIFGGSDAKIVWGMEN